ncbi:MAG: hypothetical protein AAGG01_12485, partial [Planctomycetota bacterium]
MLTALMAASAALPTLPQEPAALHPASSTFVVQVPDIQGLMGAYATTALAKTLVDSDLHASIGRVMKGEGAPPVDPIALAMGQYSQQVESGQMPPILDYLKSLESLSLSIEIAGGDVLAFGEGMEKSADQGLYAAQNIGVRLVADFVDAPSAEAVVQALAGAIGGDAPSGMSLTARAMEAPEGADGFGSRAIQVWGFAPSEAGNGANSDTFDASLKMIAGGKRVAFTAGNVDVNGYVGALSADSVGESALSLFAGGRKAHGGSGTGAPVAELFLD